MRKECFNSLALGNGVIEPRHKIKFERSGGYWKPVASGGGGGSHEFTYKTSVTNTHTTTQQRTMAWNAGIAAGFKFKGVNVGGSSGFTYTMQQSVSSVMGTTEEQTRKHSCPAGADTLYQWIVVSR